MENEAIVRILDIIKDQLSGLAGQVLDATRDGRINFLEGLTLATSGTTAAALIVAAIQELSTADAEELIAALRDSDLVLK